MAAKLANYTTTVPAQRSIAEIGEMLVERKATHISFAYANGLPIAVRFALDVRGRTMEFVLPCDEEGVHRVLQADRRRGTVSLEHSRNVAWRCVRDWLRAQVALVQIGAAKLEQIMLPYAVMHDGSTVWQRMIATDYGRKALPPGEGGAA